MSEVPAARLQQIERIIEAVREIKGRALRAAAAAQFLQAYFHGVDEEDLAARDPRYLAHMALAHRRFAALRRPRQPLVRVINPQPSVEGFDCEHTLVQVATADMPFLVDSLLLVFSRAGIGVHLIVHPMLSVCRDRRGRLRQIQIAGQEPEGNESWQAFEIDRQIAAALPQLQRALLETLADVAAVVTDWPAMVERARAAAADLGRHEADLGAEGREAQALLEWMIDHHFTFLGYRHHRLRRGPRHDLLVPTVPSGLGILRAPRRGAPPPRSLRLTGRMRREARAAGAILVTKGDSVATVHRGGYLDYVGVKVLGADGQVCAEHRFLGLWTSSAYQSSPRDVPLLRRKVSEVLRRAGLSPDSHDGKAAAHVLETYPRDELFAIATSELVDIVRGVVNLYERDQVRLFMRRDAFGRFYACLVYVPRDRYNSEIRSRIEAVLQGRLAGRSLDTQVHISESTLARLHIVVRTDPQAHRHIDLERLQQAVAAAAETWAHGLRTELLRTMDEAAALATAQRYAHAFPAAYTAEVAPRQALADVAQLEALRADPAGLRLRLHRIAGESAERVHLSIFKRGEPLAISAVLPVLENFGLRVLAERPYTLLGSDPEAARDPIRIQDFELEHHERLRIDIAGSGALLSAGFLAVWRGEIEDDGFNRLLLATGLAVRPISVLRAYCRYLLQSGVPFSQPYMERVLLAQPAVARNLFRLFERQLDPGLPAAARGRTAGIESALTRELDAVTSLDADRILRAYLHVVRATLRTNYYQSAQGGGFKDRLSFKLDSQSIPELPLPRPKFEIFVYATHVEAVHLRMAHVARGGIRWSDRREDFRTEVLGLMKAQNVKNTVIVPLGAKGGFVVRQPPGGSPEERQREGIRCYRTFMRGLLDLTDNIIDHRIVPPASVVRRDGDDPYLVVAADKGTASFSDIANALAAEYGFWLGDAFASGGSAGYDHKKMAITARGAWESVRRHFRELGSDIQQQDFTVSGIGDMSGDVFGNGMLLSHHIRLLAAFDHRHIFLDPQPDAAASFEERARLFALAGSSWDDYDRALISRGGGVWPRSAKSISLTPQVQSLLGVQLASATPQELIRAILKMPVDLLWNGGIGTYVKATGESQGQVGDRSNDGVRINGAELRARVVGEGGNLGLSQRGRVEYALAGGRLNTDFIDNSAGVNTSDAEVNIKILLNPIVHAGRLSLSRRNRLLAGMTDEIAALVLRNNYLQSQALSMLALQAAAGLPEYQHFIRALERAGDLNRVLEFLPDDETLGERRKTGAGLTRPELAVLLSYGKIWLNRHLLDSDVPEDPYLSNELERYFPQVLRRRFARSIPHHRLRREIIATATTNSLVNRMGPTFVMRAQEDTGAAPAAIARAYTAAREIFDMRSLWSDIEALDNRIPAQLQYDMMSQTARLLRHVTYWLLARRPDRSIESSVAELRASVRELSLHLAESLAGRWREHYEAMLERHTAAAVPVAVARRIALLEAQSSAPDIVELAAARRTTVGAAAQLYFGLGTRIGLDWLREQIDALQIEGAWQAVARTELRDGVFRAHRLIAERALRRGARHGAAARVHGWLRAHAPGLAQWQRMLDEMRSAGSADFATLSVGVESLRRLTAF